MNPPAAPLSLEVSKGADLTDSQLMEMALTHESLFKRRSAIILLRTRSFEQGCKMANQAHSAIVDTMLKKAARS